MKLTGNQLPSASGALDHYFSGRELGGSWPKYGYLVSNDTNYRHIRDGLKEATGRSEGRIGIFVGSGGMFSLLPDLKLAHPIMVDVNPAVTNFNSLLASIIKVSESPQDAIDRLTAVENGWDRFYENIGLAGCPNGGANFYTKLNDEALVYGQDHWTHPDRFAQTQAALIETPPTFVSADITNPNFAAALNELAAGTQTDIGFANMTNVHRWIRPKFRVTDFIENWPINPGVLMMYSEFFSNISALEMALASKQQYLDIAPRRVDNLISLMAGRAISYGAAALDANG